MTKIRNLFLAILFLPGLSQPFAAQDLEIHGFASTGYINSSKYNFIFSTENGSFEFSECAVNISAEMTDNIRIGSQFYACNLGNIGNNNVDLDWAFLDYKWKDLFGIRVGKVKTPFGLYNEIQDYDMLRTCIFLPQGIYTQYYRDLLIAIQGADAYGIIPFGKLGRIGYDVFGGSFEVKDNGSYANLFQYIFKAGFVSAEVDYLAGGRVKYFTPIEGLLFAATLEYYEMTADIEKEFTIIVPDVNNGVISLNVERAVPQIYSMEFNRGNFLFAAEYMRHKIDTEIEGVEDDFDILDVDYEAYYFLVSYRLKDWFEIGTYYSAFYWDKNDRKGENGLLYKNNYQAWSKDTAISLRFDLTYFWMLKLEGHYVDGTGLAYPPEGENFDGRSWNYFAIKTTFSF